MLTGGRRKLLRGEHPSDGLGFTDLQGAGRRGVGPGHVGRGREVGFQPGAG